jgi:hypothetical protein
MSARRNWTKDELLICLAYYSTLTKSQQRNPPKWVKEELANLISRTPDSIKLRFANFNSVDPTFTEQGLKGMVGGGAHVLTIWNEFSKNDGTLDQNHLTRALAKEFYRFERK